MKDFFKEGHGSAGHTERTGYKLSEHNTPHKTVSNQEADMRKGRSAGDFKPTMKEFDAGKKIKGA